jgi:Arc/MetJ-type ribon-helix-helix transcriptional regulator
MRYANVAIPAELLQDVREVVNDPHSHYSSLADLVKEALREKLERITRPISK